MFQTIFIGISLLANILVASPSATLNSHILAERFFSLENRYPDKWVSDVFKDNILLALAYLRGYEKTSDVDWENVRKPFHYEFDLEKGQTFAFHDDVLPEFKDSVVKSTHSHFNWSEGYKYDGWLVGDGVCHLASFINWVARDSGLEVVSPTSHDFMAIPEVPREYGVSIFANPLTSGSNSLQNLYVRNNKDYDITIAFDYKDGMLKVSVLEKAQN